MKTLYESIKNVVEGILDIDSNSRELADLADKLSECYGYVFDIINMYTIHNFEELRRYAVLEKMDIVDTAKHFIDSVETDKFYVKHHFKELEFKIDHIDGLTTYYIASDLGYGGYWILHDPTCIHIHMKSEPLKANIFAICHKDSPRSRTLTVTKMIMDKKYKGINWNRIWPKYSDNFPVVYTSSIEESEKLIKKESGGRSRNW